MPVEAIIGSSGRARAAAIFMVLLATGLPAQAQPNTDPAPALEADTIETDADNNRIFAKGAALSWQGRLLQADTLVWSRDTNIVVARGNVAITDTDGTKTLADEITLTGDMASASITGLRMRLPEDARFAAVSASRDGDNMQLKDIRYTACPECADPEAAPLWQLRAAQVDYDMAAQNVFYRHARLEIYGTPVFYTPFLAHAGPEVEKRSGFLAPRYATDSSFGFGLEVPYLFDLAPNYDFTLTPRFSEKQNPFFIGDWRHLTQRGRYDLTLYMHQPKGELASEDGDHAFRGGLTGTGNFNFGAWQLGFQAEQAGDALFFRRSKINSENTLENRVTLQRSLTNGYIRLAAHGFRKVLGDETDATVDFILPNITHRHNFAAPVLGGALSLTNRLSHTLRDLGLDATQASSRLDWSRRQTTQGGFVWLFENTLALDAYRFTNSDDSATQAPEDETLAANSSAITLSYPLVRRRANAAHYLDPQVQLVIASDNDSYDALPYTASARFDLSVGSLFRRAAPEDEVSRVNAGLRHRMTRTNGLTSDLFIGQSYNLSSRDFALSSGYSRNESAILTQAKIGYRGIEATQTLRIDSTNGEILRNRTHLGWRYNSLSLEADYARLQAGQAGSEEEELTSRAKFALNRYWSVDAGLRRNLVANRTLTSDAALVYQDDCTLARLSVSRDNTRAGGIDPETSIKLTLVLRTLGTIGRQ
jgi:LPS-assembly protein